MGDNNNVITGNNNSISTATTTTTAVNGSASGSTDARSSTTDASLAGLPKGQRDRALTLANRQLEAAGITNPTSQQTQAALNGGTVTNAQGETTELPGVLKLRGEGMGWGQVAHTIGVHPAQSEQGARHSARGFGESERIAGISASQSHALSRDSAPPIGSSATSMSGARTGAGTTTSSGVVATRAGERDRGMQAASGAASQSSLRARDGGTSIGAAAGAAGQGGSAAAISRGTDASGESRVASGALASSSIADRGKERGPAVRAGVGSDSSPGLDRSRDKGNNGKGKKH